MSTIRVVPLPEDRYTYALRVAVDPSPGGWVAYCPALLPQGAYALGESQKEALENLKAYLEEAGLNPLSWLLVVL